MKIFNLPDLGEGLQEAEIVQWHVKPGDDIAADATMVSVETDKAVVDIPAPFAGRVEKLFAAEGEVVRVGAPLIGFAGEAADAGTVVGELEPRAAAPMSAAAATPMAVRATPAVRALARQLGVDLAAVTGTGPGGAITSADVRRAAQAAPPASGEALRGMRGEGEELRGMRRAMAQRMAAAHAQVAAVTVFDDADVHAWPRGTSVLVRLLRALVAACRAEPALNAWLEGAERRRVLAEIHVGIAVDTADGLIVPVLRDAQTLDSAALERESRALIDAARAHARARATSRRNDRAIEFRAGRRPLRHADRRAAGGGHPGGGPHRARAGRARRRRRRGASRAAAVAHLRSPRGDRRRGGAVSECRDRRPATAGLIGTGAAAFQAAAVSTSSASARQTRASSTIARWPTRSNTTCRVPGIRALARGMIMLSSREARHTNLALGAAVSAA
jgi:pyruvate dehydrogenase E2 component (dihydrolipoamide acetyltransferase)